jgi:predicted nucleic acid-binding protein
LTDAWVIDSSVAIAWVHPSQATPETDGLLTEVDTGSKIIVPVLWFLEIANALLVLQRRKKITVNERKLALQILSELNPTVDEEGGGTVFGRVSEIAEKHGLSVYDATYLEIALRRKLPLASLDHALRTAAKRCSVKVL